MPPLTWKNINTPGLSGSLAAQSAGSQQLLNAFSSLGEIGSDIQDTREANVQNRIKQNTLDLSAQIQNADSVDQLNQRFNDSTLRDSMGAMYDPSAIATARTQQEDKLRGLATDNAVTQAGTLSSNQEVFDYLDSLGSDVNKATVRDILKGRIAGTRADTDHARQLTEQQRKDTLRVGGDAFTNTYLKTGDAAQGYDAMVDAGVNPSDALSESIRLQTIADTPTAMENAEYTGGVASLAGRVSSINAGLDEGLANLRQQAIESNPISEFTSNAYTAMRNKGQNSTAEIIKPYEGVWQQIWGNSDQYILDQEEKIMKSGAVENREDAQQIIMQALNNVQQGDSLNERAYSGEVDKLVQRFSDQKTLNTKLLELAQFNKSIARDLGNASQNIASTWRKRTIDPSYRGNLLSKFDYSEVDAIESRINKKREKLLNDIQKLQKKTSSASGFDDSMQKSHVIPPANAIEEASKYVGKGGTLIDTTGMTKEDLLNYTKIAGDAILYPGTKLREGAPGIPRIIGEAGDQVARSAANLIR